MPSQTISPSSNVATLHAFHSFFITMWDLLLYLMKKIDIVVTRNEGYASFTPARLFPGNFVAFLKCVKNAYPFAIDLILSGSG
jgi:hypothetical protein